MPGQMNPSQARVIDPILSNHAQKHRNAQFVLEALFPVVMVGQRGGRVIKFNKDSFRRFSTRRAPGTNTKRVQFGYASDPIALMQDSMEGQVPIELLDEARAVPGINLGANAVETVLDVMGLGVEYERAQIATDANNYGTNKETLAGTDQWSDPAADVKTQINDAKQAIRKRVGHMPNILTISSQAQSDLESNTAIKEQFKYTSSESITLDMLARYFQVEKVIVPEAVSLPDGAADSADLEDVWGNFAVLAYVPPNAKTIDVPSFGYTYRLNGHPLVEQAYFERNPKSWFYPVTVEERAYHTAADAGYLFTDVS
ncbi:MAG: hypothetical protein ACN4GR_01685 [Arenicellales bacterium]